MHTRTCTPPLRLSGRRVLPSDAGPRALTAPVVGGRVGSGERVVVLSSGRESLVERVIAALVAAGAIDSSLTVLS